MGRIGKNVLIDIVISIFFVVFFIIGSEHIISKIVVDTNIETLKEIAVHDKKVLKNSLESHWESFNYISTFVKKYNLSTEKDIIKVLQAVNSLSTESTTYLINSDKVTYSSTGEINNDLKIYNIINIYDGNFAIYYDDYDFSIIEGRKEYLIIGTKFKDFYINEMKIDYAYTRFYINRLNDEFKIYSFNGKGFSSLIDSDGTFIVNVNRTDSNSQRDNFYNYLNIDSNEINTIKENANFSDGYIFYSTINNIKYVIYIVGLEGTDWYFVSQVPIDAFSPLTIELSLVSIISVFVILIILIIFISNKFKLIKEKEEKEKNYNIILSHALDDARVANKAKTTFLNNMSHDIRTPMNAIIGYTDLAINHYDNSKLILNYLNKISNSSEYLLNLINDILDMSRIESGRVILNKSNESLKDIINSNVTIVSNSIEKKKINFKINYDVIDDNIICDRVRLSKIILNVLSNAIKYTKAYGKISLDISQNNSIYKFVFTDNGIGIKSEFIDKIFEPFTREERNSNNIQGTGLGMAITKSLVDIMNGTIKCESKENIGSKFTVEIPLVIDKKIKLEESNQSINKSFSGKRILLVDDNELNQDIVRVALKDIGIGIVIANNGKECFDIISKDKSFDIILMDITMPIMDGYTTTSKIRGMKDEYYINIPIIAMSANAFIDDSKKGLAIGMNDYITKPIRIDNLIKVIGKYLG